MRRIYTFLLYFSIPFILLRLYWKGRKLPAYRERIQERFFLTNGVSNVDVWIHAVSLGEVIAATPLIEMLLAKGKKILVTTMTPTGAQQVKTHFKDRVTHQYLPYDFPWVLRRFFRQIKPQVGIIMETELWPNLIHEAKRAKIRLFLANARISDKAYKQYQKMAFFFTPILEKFTAILAQSELDAERFIALGAPKDHVHALGNMKFDIQIQVHNAEEITVLKQLWGKERPIIIAASTHDDEEAQLLKQLICLQSAVPDILLLIAPRHPERFNTVYELCVQHGFKTGLRSKFNELHSELDIVVLDSMGELLGFYQVSDYAFVGGSLVPLGGHNVLEPIAMDVPVLCGPYMQNSKAICSELLAANAIQMHANIEKLMNAIIQMYQNPKQREQQINNAKKVLSSNRGAVVRYLEFIERI